MLNATNHLGARGWSARSSLGVGFTLAVAALVLLAQRASGQEPTTAFDLVGTVTDAQSGQPLTGAWVALEGSDWGSISDDAGRFRLPSMSPGPLRLEVEQLGYETLAWEGTVDADTGLLQLALTPQPLVLEGLEVMTDRFRARRNASATTVRAFDAEDLTTTAQRTALDFVTVRAGTASVYCAGRRGGTCLLVRGRPVEPTVYLDEAPVIGGLEYLDTFAPHELYMIEIFGGGRQIRAYTPAFMERVARHRIHPVALFF